MTDGVLLRIATVATNAFREASRATVLHGILILALATTLYSVVLGTLSLHQEARVVADIGAASGSIFAVVAVTVLGATALHREIELKTIFPVLTRKLRRHEYLVGKFAGLVLTAWVFLALHSYAVFVVLALLSGRSAATVAGGSAALLLPFAIAFATRPRLRVFLTIPLAFALALFGYWLAAPAGAEAKLVAHGLVLSGFEVLVVAGLTIFFSAFSTSYLTAVFTAGMFIAGRSSDTLAHIPTRFFGPEITSGARILSHLLPNLNLFVPARPVLLGLAERQPIVPLLLSAGGYALAYASILLAFATLIFRKRDFT
jgi:Cu-processing system permease protein